MKIYFETLYTSNFKIRSEQQLYNLVRNRLYGQMWEHFIICLMKDQEVIALTDTSYMSNQGTSQVSFSYIELSRILVSFPETELIIAHNHPTGTPYFSVEDKETTEKVKEICTLLDIEFKDHLLLAGEDIISYEHHSR